MEIKLIGRCSLNAFLWEQLTRCYGYQSDAPGIRDFAIELFKSCYAIGVGGGGTDGQVKLTGDALVFLKRWKDSRQFEGGFETLAGLGAEVLGIEQDLAKRDFRDLIELDYFRLIDQKIISDLVRAVAARTVSSGDVALWVCQRRQGHWYPEYRHLYEAVDVAAQFTHALGEAKLDMDSLAEGVQRYSRCWYRLDQLYRKFIVHVRLSGQASLMGSLTEQIEALYSNNYLLKLGDGFQTCVDAASKWEAFPVRKQKAFFKDFYIYHNRIDATGDKRESEERVFEAVEETLQELIRLIKKLTGANASNVLVTSDHGFLYQNRAIDESDFSGVDAEGNQILFRGRRFVLGKGLAEAASLHKFTPEQLGLAGEVEVQIPKSINRLRLKGSGSRFVHGGASLQEVVIPVLKVHKKRQSDVTAVEVDILRGASSVITAGQLAVTLYQAGPGR